MQELPLTQSVTFEGSCSVMHSVGTIALSHGDGFEACSVSVKSFYFFHDKGR